MKKTKSKATRLTSKSKDEEVIRWTKSHDVFDRLETGVSEVVEDHSDLDEVLREAIFQDNTAQLNMGRTMMSSGLVLIDVIARPGRSEIWPLSPDSVSLFSLQAPQGHKLSRFYLTGFSSRNVSVVKENEIYRSRRLPNLY
jgi:hypothetical protein